jgi:hypothetical protein
VSLIALHTARPSTCSCLKTNGVWTKKKESSEVVHLAMMATTRVPINNAQVVRR